MTKNPALPIILCIDIGFIQHSNPIPVHRIFLLTDMRHYDNTRQIAVILTYKNRYIQFFTAVSHFPYKIIFPLPYQFSAPCGKQSQQRTKSRERTFVIAVQIHGYGFVINHPIVFIIVIACFYVLYLNMVHIYSPPKFR